MALASDYIIPVVYTKQGKHEVDEDLGLSSLLWTLESEREKGGGLLRKKAPEKVTQVSFLYRPILVLQHQGTLFAFDGCAIQSTRFKFGVAPSLTFVRRFLRSENWAFKPEAYAAGLNRHSEDFERAKEQNSYEVRGWITDPSLVKTLSELVQNSSPSTPRTDAFPMLLSEAVASDLLADLDRLRHLMRSEN